MSPALLSSSRHIAALALAAVVIGLVGCTTGSDRPDPTEVVQRYLDAIADGDATTASELDRTAVISDAATAVSVEVETLRTDDVLAGAQRIENVRIDPDTTGAARYNRVDELGVTFSFELAGEQYDSMLPVGWNEESGEWELLDTLAEKLVILAQVSRIEIALIGFSVPGASVAPPADQGTAPLSWLVYPGVYTVTADFDPALLVDPSPGIERDVVIAPSGMQPSLTYEVTSLP